MSVTRNAGLGLGLVVLMCYATAPAPGAQKTAPKPSGSKPPASKPAVPAPAAIPSGPRPIAGSCNVSPIVADLELAIPFYQRVLGLQVPAAPDGERPFDSKTPVLDMLGVRGAEMRSATARTPGSPCGVEIVEFGMIERAPRNPQPQDPGAVTLVLVVRDVEPIFTRALAADVPILTTGGVPISVPSEGGAGVLLRDTDGHFVEVLQAIPPPVAPGSSAGNIVGWRVRLSVRSTEEALKLYRERFGLEVRAGALARNKAFTALNGLADVPVRTTIVTLPGGGRFELVEYTGVTRTPIDARIQDPGATRFQLQVTDVQTAAGLATEGGATMVSPNGAAVSLPGGEQAAVVRDPDNLFLLLSASPSQSRER